MGSWEGSAVDFAPAQRVLVATFLQHSLGKTTSCTVTPCLALRRQPFCDLGSTNHFVPEIVLALQTRAKPINIVECFCSKEQEVKCYNLTFGPDLLKLSLTDRQNVDQDECVFPSRIIQPTNMSLEAPFNFI